MAKEKSYRSYFLAILSGNAVSQLIPFLIVPFITRIFTKDEIATSANWISIVTLIGIVATGRLEVAIPLPKSQKEARFVFSSGLIFTIAITLLSCILLFFTDEIAAQYKDPFLGEILWLIPVGVLSIGLLGITTNWSLRNRRYQQVSIGKIVQSIINNLGAVALGYYAFGVFGLVFAWVVSQFFNIFLLLGKGDNRAKLFVSKMDVSFFRKIVKKYKDFPLINSLHAFTDIFATQFLLFYMITVYFSKEELALFYLMFRYVKAPIGLISTSVGQLFYVEAGKAVSNQQSGLPVALQTMKTVSVFAIPFAVIVLLFGPTLFEIYLGSTWRDAGVYAQYMTPMFVVFFFVSPLSGTPLIFNQQKTAFLFSVIGYSFTLGSIVLGHYLNWKFTTTLGLYSVLFSMYYLVLIGWYLQLLRRYNG
jgi:O-antigen/teichoic acid export membrane protein